MSRKPSNYSKEAQNRELYELSVMLYDSLPEEYHGDSYVADAILAEAEITKEISENVGFFDDNGISIKKALARKRRCAERASKRRLNRSAINANNNLPARLSHSSRYPKSTIPRYESGKRICKAAKKLGLEI